MPSLPTASDVHVNRPLTNIAIAVTQDEKNFVAGRVFPTVPVSKKSDTYFIWDRGDFNRDEAAEVGPGGEAPITGLRVSSDSYECKVFKLAAMVSDQERANADQPLNLDVTKTEDITRKLMIRRERRWAERFFTTSVWTGSTTGADLVGGADFVVWSNYAGSDPVTVIRAQAFNLTKNLGVPMSDLKLTLGAEVFLQLLDHPKFLERYEQVQASIMNEQLMAAVLGIGEVIVPMAVHNTAKEGAAVSMSFIHGKSALLTYSPAGAAINRPSAGYMFMWTGLYAGSGVKVKRWRRERFESDQIEGAIAFDPKATCAFAGVFFSAAVA